MVMLHPSLAYACMSSQDEELNNDLIIEMSEDEAYKAQRQFERENVLFDPEDGE